MPLRPDRKNIIQYPAPAQVDSATMHHSAWFLSDQKPWEGKPKEFSRPLTTPLFLASSMPQLRQLTTPEMLNGVMPPSKLASANIKPRLRMITVYAIAQTLGYLVCGTGNKDEVTIGYFTKYGDGGSDFMPLADLTKGEVREIARVLNIPSVVIDKPPSAGLWEGQTDEQEMGLTYDVLDAYVSGQPVSERDAREIECRIRASEHKRSMPPKCVIGDNL